MRRMLRSNRLRHRASYRLKLPRLRFLQKLELARQLRIYAGLETACRLCGCSESKACRGGCYWIEPGLCSACVEER